MLEFASESPVQALEARRSPLPWAAGLLILVVVAGAGAWMIHTRTKAAPAEGMLRIESEPQGAAVEVNGSLRGLTPLTLTLPAGPHAVVVNHETQKHEIAATISSGIESVHHVRFTSATPTLAVPAADRGRLHVTSDLPDAMV
jgi:hypothetical protein